MDGGWWNLLQCNTNRSRIHPPTRESHGALLSYYFVLSFLPWVHHSKCVIVIAHRSGESTIPKEPPPPSASHHIQGRGAQISGYYILLAMQLEDARLTEFVILAKLQYYLPGHHHPFHLRPTTQPPMKANHKSFWLATALHGSIAAAAALLLCPLLVHLGR